MLRFSMDGIISMTSMKHFIPAFHWHFLTSSYETFFRPFARRIWQRMATETIERTPRGGTVIDLGCGPGTILRLIRDKRPDLTLIGADIDPAIIHIAEQEAAAKNIQFLVTSIDEVPFETQSADIVISSLMFHHLDELVKHKAMEQIRRILKPNGMFLLCDFSVPKHSWLTPIASLFLAIEHEAPKQLRGQLFALAREAHMTIETLETFYGCISLHRMIPKMAGRSKGFNLLKPTN